MRMIVLRAGAVFVILAALSLAMWQFNRAEQKRQLETQAQNALTAAAIDIDGAPNEELPVFRHARARGIFMADKTILLDNRLHNRRAGYYVITPLLLADGTALAVNRGWLAGGKTRIPPPPAPMPPPGEVVVAGHLAADESDALVLSGKNRDGGGGTVWQRLVLDDYAAFAGIKLLGRVLVGEGESGLIPPPAARADFRSARSVGYAFQWLSLALLAAVFYVVLARREKAKEKAKAKAKKAAAKMPNAPDEKPAAAGMAKTPQAQQKPKTRKTPLVVIVAIAVLTPAASTIMFYFWQPAAATHKGEVITAQNAPDIFPPPSWKKAGDGNGENAEGGFLDNNAGEQWRREWRGKWILLHATSSAHCDEQCRRRLCRMRQLRLMLPGHYLRINRAWLINQTADDSGRGGGNAKNTGGIGAKKITATSDCGEIRTETSAAQRAAEVDIVRGVFVLRGDGKTLPPPSGDWRRDDYLYLIDPAGRLAMRFSPALNIYDIRSDMSRLLKLSRGWRQTR